MRRDNPIKRKSFNFALKIVNLYKYLSQDKREYILSKQLLRSGTSIGANIREADNAESKADFVHKMAISQKETDETLYWLELLHNSDYLKTDEFNILHSEASEILKIIRTIILNTKENIKK